MGYAKGPYSNFSSLPAPEVIRLHASRKLNFETKRYEFDDDGNPLQQPSIQQIVTMKLAFNVPDQKAITPQEQEASRQDVLSSLAELTAAPSPLIDRVEVVFSSEGAGEQRNVVNFRDLSTGLDDSVEF